MTFPTSFRFLERYLEVYQNDMEVIKDLADAAYSEDQQRITLQYIAHYLLELTLVEVSMN